MTLQEFFLFGRHLLNNFSSIGGITPCSPSVARHIVRSGRISKAHTILEIGPGLGSLTKEILKHAPPDAQIIAIEKIADFAEYLKQTLSDKRLQVLQGDIFEEKTKDYLKASFFDVIISSIPLSFAPREQKAMFSRLIKKVLKPEGVFINAQFSLANKKYFKEQSLQRTWNLEWGNLPPVFIQTFMR